MDDKIIYYGVNYTYIFFKSRSLAYRHEKKNFQFYQQLCLYGYIYQNIKLYYLKINSLDCKKKISYTIPKIFYR